MSFRVVEASTGQIINEFGAGTTLSNMDLGAYTIVFEPAVAGAESVTFTLNGQEITTSTAPFAISGQGGSDQAFQQALLAPGDYAITATVYSGSGGSGSVLQEQSTSFAVTGEIGSGGSEAGGSNDLQEDQRTEFNVEAEAETEAETEAEAEVGTDIAGAATASSAVASVYGSNAIAQTLASGSVSLDVQDATEKPGVDSSAGEGPSGAGGRPVGGDAPLSGGDPAVAVAIASGEAEAEAEVEAEAEAEVSAGSAAAAAGISGAVAAVGTNVSLQSDGSPALTATETVSSIDGASGTNTSVSDQNGIVDVAVVAADADDEGTPDAAVGTPAGETDNGPTTEELQAEKRADALIITDSETEVEVEAEAEAEAEVAAGTAAAAVAGGAGVAVAGDFAAADTETSVGTVTSTSAVTEFTPDLFALGTQAPGTLSTTSAFVPAADATAVVFSNGAETPAGTSDPAATTPAGDTGSDVIPGTGLFEAEAEAEAEVEVEAEAGNNAAAVAVVATGGGGASGVGATANVSASTSGSAATSDHAGELVRANDAVESTSFRSDDDPELTAELANARVENGGIAAEAEAEAETEAEVNLATPAVNVLADGSGIGDAVAASGVTVGGVLTARQGEVSTGVSDVAERPQDADEPTRAREVVGSGDQTMIAAPSGNLEVEVEAEAEAEAEAEVSFNAAAAGAGALAVEARNTVTGITADAATATSTSVSVRDGGEQSHNDSDQPGPSPLNSSGTLAYPPVDLNALILEVETEAEAEAEVGIAAGAAAAAAGAAGFEGIRAVIDMSATANAAAAAAAAGAYTDVRVFTPPEGMAGFVTAYARAWDPEGRGVAVAVAVAGLSENGGADNEAEIEAEGLFEAVVEVSVYTEAYDPENISYLFDISAPLAGDEDGEPEGPDSVIESEAEVEAEAEAEAGYGVAAAAAATAASGFAATAVADTMTATQDLAAASELFGGAFDGTTGADTQTGTDRVDLMRGLSGDDLLDGGAGGDRIEGGAGNDTLIGGEGDDALFGDGGDDRLEGGPGANMIDGGAGVDTVVVNRAQSDLIIVKDLNGTLFIRDTILGDTGTATNVEIIETEDGDVAVDDIGVFNGLSFIASNPELTERFANQGLEAAELINIATQIFATTPEGTYAPPSFDAQNFLDANPDLAIQFGSDLVGATLDFINSGAAAGRDPGAPANPPSLTDGPAPMDGSGGPTGTNQAPVIASPILPQAASTQQPFTYELPETAFRDPDMGQEVTLTVENLPAGLSFLDGTVRGTPLETGTFFFTVIATDPFGLTAEQEVRIEIVDEPLPPSGEGPEGPLVDNEAPSLVFELPDQDASTLQPFFFQVPETAFVDPNLDQTLVLTTSDLPEGILFSEGTFSGQAREVGTFDITVTATDPGGLSASDIFTITVTDDPITVDPGGPDQPNTAPVVALQVEDQTALTGERFTFALPETLFADPDPEDELTTTATGLPAGLTFADGSIQGTPLEEGVFTVTLTASDGQAAVSQDFDITVEAPSAPTPPTPGNEIPGTDGNDRLTGTSGNDLIDGMGGADRIDAGAGDDIVIGGAGNDYTLRGGTGADAFGFGIGSDVDRILDFEDSIDVIQLLGGLTFADLSISGFTVNGTQNTNVFTEAGDRLVLLGVSVDQIEETDFTSDAAPETGGGTPDTGGDPQMPVIDSTIPGTDGNDRLTGTDGNDLIDGMGGADRIDAGAGSDIVIGGAGNDYNLRGGADADTFGFGIGSDVDRVLDFEDSIDVIELLGGVSYADLSINGFTVNGTEHTNVFTDAGDRLVLLGVSVDQIDQTDFLIA